MAPLLILILLCAILLAVTGSLSLWLSSLIVICSLVGLAIESISKRRNHQLLKKHQQLLKARWGIQIHHLGGLTQPMDTPGNLFMQKERLLLETENENITMFLADIQHVLLTTAEQIRRIPDHELCNLLETGNCRLFSALREKIRYRDSFLSRHGILLIAYLTAEEELHLLILATNLRPQSLANLFQIPALEGKIHIQIHSAKP